MSAFSLVVSRPVRPCWARAGVSVSVSVSRPRSSRWVERRTKGQFTRAAASDEEQQDVVPPGCSRYIAKLSKPLGIVLEETKDGRLLVGEVQAGGNAERHNETATADKLIRKGDQIVAVSGFTRAGASQVYGEIEVRGGEKMVRVVVGSQPQDKRWDIVVSAISSHLAGMLVELEFQRCE